MSCLYKRKDSPYWWWTERYKGRRVSKSTKMAKRHLAMRVKEKWDMNLIMEDLSFLGMSQHSPTTVKEFVSQYLDFLDHRKSRNTIAIASGVFLKLQEFLEVKSIRFIDAITVKTLNQYIDSLDCAPKTKKNHIGVISLMFEQAIREEVIVKNPAKLVALPNITKVVKHRSLTEKDLQIIFSNAGKWLLYYTFLYLTGLRAGDVAKLTHGNIDRKKGAIIGFVRKSRRLHEFPIAQSLLDQITKTNEDNPIFPALYTESDRKLNDNLAIPRKYLQKVLALHNRPKATLHSFRVTFNNQLRDLGLSIEDRQVLLAHASSETTKIYTHSNFDLASEYVNKIPLYNGPARAIVGKT